VTQFLTLMRREWMQHRTGWLVLLLAPTVVLLALSFVDGAMQINVNDHDVQLPPLRHAAALVQTGLMLLAVTGTTFVLALLTLSFQLPGLARRDQQDGSIAFWCSLPVGHGKSVAALLVTHILLLPWLALLAGMAGGLLAALVAVVASLGPLAWLTQPWGLLLASIIALLLRLSLGLLIAAAWLSPVILLTMAAAAWLKRWGVPVVVAISLAGTLVLDKYLAQPVVGPALHRLSSEALQALLRIDALQGFSLRGADDVEVLLRALPMLQLHEMAALLTRAATPGFVLALAGGALGFALLVLRRQRSV